MGTAVLPARRRVAVSAWTVAPSALALAFGVLYWFVRLSTRFAPERIIDHDRRCDDG